MMSEEIAESEVEEEVSMADSIEAAIDANGEDNASESESTSESVESVDTESPKGEVAEEGGEDAQESAGATDAAQDTEEKPDLDNAPSSLPPAAREAWKDAPEAIKEAMVKREDYYQQGIDKFKADAGRAQEMDQALRPFEQYLGMNGGHAHIGELLRTGASLQMGTQAQKAEQIAGLIQQFGVDINTLDGILSGNGAPQATQQSDAVAQQVQAALQPYQQMMQQQQQQQQNAEQQSQNNVQNEIGAFSSDTANEFYNDVRSDMADILDMAAKHGTQMNLKQAYDRACQLHPEISSVITARNAQNDLGAKRNAASSINGTRGGTNSATPTGSIRDTLDHVWDNAGGRV
jgi:hypothetical protein